MQKKFTWLLFTSLILSSCQYIYRERIKGNGNIVVNERNIASFHSIDAGGAMHIFLHADSAGHQVRVEADENLQEYIDIYERDGTLFISQEENVNLNPTKRIRVHVYGPLFKKIAVSGASELHGENKLVQSEPVKLDLSGASELELDLKAPEVIAELSGASSMTLKGETRNLVLDGSGASRFRCAELLSENVRVDVSGASSADVFASVKLDVKASGASGVKYGGSPAITQDLSGASNIKKSE